MSYSFINKLGVLGAGNHGCRNCTGVAAQSGLQVIMTDLDQAFGQSHKKA